LKNEPWNQRLSVVMEYALHLGCKTLCAIETLE